MASRELSTVLRHLRCLSGDAGAADLTDRQLLSRFVEQSDEAAFADLVRRHAALVLGVCRRVLSQQQDVEDVFQATFLVLVRKAASSRWRESIGNWLHEVAHRLALKSRADTDRRLIHERRAAMAQAKSESDRTSRELCAKLDEELRRLPRSYRESLLLCYLEGQTRDEAAQQLGCSLRTLHRRLERGLKVLRVRLTARGLTLSAALVTAALSQQAASASSPLLVESTVRAALAFATKATSDANVSPAVAALVEGGIKSMSVAKAKFVVALVLAVSGVAGAGALAHHALAARQPESKPETPKTVSERAEPSSRTDRFGDPLPPGALFRLGSLRLRHKTSIHSTAFAAGGSVLIAADDSGAIRFWEPATGKELRHIRGSGAIACSPDGKTLAVLESKSVVLRDVATGEQLRELRRRVGNSRGASVPVLFAPDGRTIAALAGEKSVSVWNVATGREQAQLVAHEKPIVCLGFAADGKSVLTAVGNRTEDIVLRQWDSGTGEELLKVRIPAAGRKAWLRPLAFSPDGKTIALEEAAEARVKEGNVTHVFTEYRLYLADVATGQERRRLDATSEVIWSAAFASDSKSVACQRMDGSVSVWNTATGETRFTHRGYPGSSRPDGAVTLAFTPDGKTLAGVGESGAIHLWDVGTGREVGANSETHQGGIICLAFEPNGRTAVTGSNDHTIRLWDTRTGRQRLRLDGHSRSILRLAFSRDGKTLASAGGDDTIRLWDPATGKERQQFEEKRQSRSSYINYGVHALVFPPDGQTLVSWGEDQMLRVWDLATAKERSAQHVQLPGLPEPPQPKPGEPHPPFPDDHISGAAFTPDGRTVLLASNSTVYLVEVASGRTVFSFPSSPAAQGPLGPKCLDLSPDGQTLVIGAWDKSIHLFELATGKHVFRVNLPEAAGRAAFSPDGRMLAVAGSRPKSTIRIHDVATGEKQSELGGPDAFVRALAFRPDGQMLATGLSDTTTVLWKVAAAPPQPQKRLTAGTRDQLWGGLADPDAAKAYTAMGTLAANPDQAVELLSQRLRAAPPIDPHRLQALLSQLDHHEFAQREEASRELKKLGAAAEPALRALLARTPSAEAARRAKDILATPPPWTPQDSDALRRRRAIQVLERIGSPAAGLILEKLAKGTASAPETRLAKDARKRVSQRAP